MRKVGEASREKNCLLQAALRSTHASLLWPGHQHSFSRASYVVPASLQFHSHSSRVTVHVHCEPPPRTMHSEPAHRRTLLLPRVVNRKKETSKSKSRPCKTLAGLHPPAIYLSASDERQRLGGGGGVGVHPTESLGHGSSAVAAGAVAAPRRPRFHAPVDSDRPPFPRSRTPALASRLGSSGGRLLPEAPRSRRRYDDPQAFLLLPRRRR